METLSLANPATAEFSGAEKLNAAFRRRMAVWINFKYQSIGEKIAAREAELVMKRSKVDEDTAYKLLKRARPYGPSPGDIINWAVLCHDSVNPKKAAEETIISLTSDNHEVQEDVRQIIESVFR